MVYFKNYDALVSESKNIKNVERLNGEGRRNEPSQCADTATSRTVPPSRQAHRMQHDLMTNTDGGGAASRAALGRRPRCAAPSASHKWRRKSSFNQRTRVSRRGRGAGRERRLASGKELLTSQLKISYTNVLFLLLKTQGSTLLGPSGGVLWMPQVAGRLHEGANLHEVQRSAAATLHVTKLPLPLLLRPYTLSSSIGRLSYPSPSTSIHGIICLYS